MSNTRYGHSSVGGGNQDQGEKKDEGWTSRQGGDQSREPGGEGEPRPGDAPGRESRSTSQPPAGTNTQGELAGIGEASRKTAGELDPTWREGESGSGEPASGDDSRGAGEANDGQGDRVGGPPGTDQPPRMGGPLGPDRNDPHLPEGAQDNAAKGSGAGGFDRGVDATNVGAVHQGVRAEDEPSQE